MLDGGPWSFDNHLLLLHQLTTGDIPHQAHLFHVNFWIQIYDLPVGYMSENVGRQIGEFIGKFIEYDVNNSTALWRSFMRIKVAIDVRKPLKRCKKIRRQGGD